MATQDTSAEASGGNVRAGVPSSTATIASAGGAGSRARFIWGWTVSGAAVVALLSLIITFYVTLHHFSSAGHAMSESMGGEVDFDSFNGPRAPVPQRNAETARRAVHSHTASAVFCLSAGLAVFVAATVIFLGALAQYLSLRANSATPALVAPSPSESEAASDADHSPPPEPTEADKSRFEELMSSPDSSASAADSRRTED